LRWACLVLLAAGGGADPVDLPSSRPPSPTPEVGDFSEQWYLALDSLGAAVEEASQSRWGYERDLRRSR
jgi:hypothetical protein